MTNLSDQCDSGYFVLLETLNRHLADMSDGLHQWGSTTVPGTFPDRDGSPHSFVLLAYSNPDAMWLLNPIVVIAPLFSLGGENTEHPGLIVSLSSKSISPLKSGLYYEDGEVRYDSVEDFTRIWNPIKNKLWPELSDRKRSTTASVLGEAKAAHHTPAYRTEFLEYVDSLARYPDVQVQVAQVPDFDYVMTRISALFRHPRKDQESGQ